MLYNMIFKKLNNVVFILKKKEKKRLSISKVYIKSKIRVHTNFPE